MSLNNPYSDKHNFAQTKTATIDNWEDALQILKDATLNNEDPTILDSYVRNLEKIARTKFAARDYRWIETHNCIASVALKESKFAVAQDHLNKALEIQRDHASTNHEMELSLHTKLVNCAIMDHDEESARRFYAQLDYFVDRHLAHNPISQFQRYTIKAIVHWNFGEVKEGVQALGYAVDLIEKMKEKDRFACTNELYKAGITLQNMYMPRESVWLLDQARTCCMQNPDIKELALNDIDRALLASLVESKNTKRAHHHALEMLSRMKEDPKTKVDEKLEIRFTLLQTLQDLKLHEKALNIAKKIIEQDETERGPGGAWNCRFRIAAAEIAFNLGRLNDSRQFLVDTEKDIIAMLPAGFESILNGPAEQLTNELNKNIAELPYQMRLHVISLLSILAKRDFLAISLSEQQSSLMGGDKSSYRALVLSTLALSTKSTDFQLHKGILFSELRFHSNHEEAKRLLTCIEAHDLKKINLTPPTHLATRHLISATLLEDLGLSADARKSLDTALDVVTAYPGTYGSILEASIHFTRARWCMAHQEISQAVIDLEAALDICEELEYQKSPYFGAILYSISEAYEQEGKYEKAAAAIERLHELRSNIERDNEGFFE